MKYKAIKHLEEKEKTLATRIARASSLSTTNIWGQVILFCRASQVAQWYRIHLPMQETQEMWVRSLGQKDPLEWKWQPTPVFWLGKFHRWRRLVGYSP